MFWKFKLVFSRYIQFAEFVGRINIPDFFYVMSSNFSGNTQKFIITSNCSYSIASFLPRIDFYKEVCKRSGNSTVVQNMYAWNGGFLVVKLLL